MTTPSLRSNEGYDPNKSQVNDHRLAEWLEAELSPDIQSVPGIGPQSAQKLAVGDDGVHPTYQLIGRFLTLKGANATSQEHCDALWFWLQAKGVHQYRSGIVQCLVEKLEIMMPELYQKKI